MANRCTLVEAEAIHRNFDLEKSTLRREPVLLTYDNQIVSDMSDELD